MGFYSYLLVITVDPPPLNHFLSLRPTLSGKFTSMRCLRVTMIHSPNGVQKSNRNGLEKKKKISIIEAGHLLLVR